MAENFGNRSDSPQLKRPWDSQPEESGSGICSGDSKDDNIPFQANKRPKESGDFLNLRSDEVNSTTPSHSCQSQSAESESDSGVPRFEENGPQPSTSTADQPNTSGDFLGMGDTPELNFGGEPGASDPNITGNPGEEDAEDNISDISGLSDISLEGEGWRPMAGPMSWVQRQMQTGADPRALLGQLLPDDTVIPEGFDDFMLWKVIVNIVTEPPKRKKLPDINTLDDVIELMKNSKKIMVLTGAGVSVSCGIPDFRSRDGIYARLHVEYPDLPDPQAMFDIVYFRKNPNPFYKFAKEIYPGQFEPSKSHKFIQMIESQDKLLRNYTQNIDTLEQVAGITKVIQCHGSFAKATCMSCKHKVDAEVIREDIMAQIIPRCPNCPPEDLMAIMKPDIVFFGESLPEEFHSQMDIDKDNCDLLIVIGSSLKVRPVALIPNSLPNQVPQILINREPLKHLNFDVELLGDCDVIVNELCHRLGAEWSSLCTTEARSTEISRDELLTPPSRSPAHTDKSTEDNSPKVPEESETVDSTEPESTAPNSQEAESTSEQKQNGSHNAGEGSSPVPVSEEAAAPDSGGNDPPADTEAPGSSCCSSTTPAEQTQSATSMETNGNSEQIAASTDTADPVDNGTAEAIDANGDSAEPVASSSTNPMDSAPTQKELEEMRSYWQPRVINIAARLPENTYLHAATNRYIFRGAEVYENPGYDDDEDEEGDESSLSSDSDLGNEGDLSQSPDNEPSSSADTGPGPGDGPAETSGEPSGQPCQSSEVSESLSQPEHQPSTTALPETEPSTTT